MSTTKDSKDDTEKVFDDFFNSVTNFHQTVYDSHSNIYKSIKHNNSTINTLLGFLIAQVFIDAFIIYHLITHGIL
jgi:hypothetical protein